MGGARSTRHAVVCWGFKQLRRIVSVSALKSLVNLVVYTLITSMLCQGLYFVFYLKPCTLSPIPSAPPKMMRPSNLQSTPKRH